MKFLKLLMLLLCIQQFAFAQKKPNILWITYEDTSPQFIGCYGNKDAKTPVLDKLAAEGIRFTNAFSTGTVCSPSRSTLITGVRTFEMGTGNHRSNYKIPDFIHGFPYYMQKAGYYTTNNSKTDYNVANPKEFIKQAWDESSGKAGWWNRKPGQPFFAVFNYMDSHQSRTMTFPYPKYISSVINELPEADRIGENDFAMPPFYKDSPEMRKQFARVYNSIKLTDNKIGELLQKLKDDNLLDSTIVFCFADHGEGMPRGKTNGIDYGYRVPFIAWFPSMYKNLSPWKTGGIVTDELIDFEDLAPSMLALAGADVPKYMEGRVLIGAKRAKPVDHLILSSDRSDNGVDMVRSVTNGNLIYSRNYYPFINEARYINYMEIGDIKKQMRKDFAEGKLNPLQKSLFEDRPTEFLFDLSKDVWETRNLVNDIAYATALQKMRKQLDDKLKASKDIMFLPEYELAQISKTTSPYLYRLDNPKYPFDKIYAAASLAGKRGAPIVKQQIGLLSNDNKIVRYWAALGLRSQPFNLLQPYKKQILANLNDNYPPAQSTLCAVAYAAFKDTQAESNLKKLIKSDNELLALMTINYLIYTPNREVFLSTIQGLLSNKKLAYNVQSAGRDFLRSLDIHIDESESSE
ncbi:sulfatase [Pedobacter sp. SD-b]|uniref:Sulfatase n=1 Tax=Pedobacter segetis TaxID=2793069 RepID=A0ABS1BMU9_9SPHI|nr:sulfatase [Pedobacter segetis]MBK0384066.1 sulfatase [Pedobacter segetis]